MRVVRHLIPKSLNADACRWPQLRWRSGGVVGLGCEPAAQAPRGHGRTPAGAYPRTAPAAVALRPNEETHDSEPGQARRGSLPWNQAAAEFV